MDWVQIGLLFVAFLLVLLNGYFVAAEFAIVKTRPTQLEELVRSGSRLAKLSQPVLRKLDDHLSATQLGITLASLGLGWIGERAVARMIEPALVLIGVGSPLAVHGVATAIAFTIISFLHIVLGELAPKSLAIRRSVGTTLWTAPPLRLFYVLMYPAIIALNGSSLYILRLFGLPPASEAEHAHSPEELEMIVESSAKQGLLNEQERQLLENALAFSERYVHEIMVPRPDMVCLRADRTVEENVAIVERGRHTRYPLIEGDREEILGMVHVKDLFLLDRQRRVVTGERERDALTVSRIARDVTFVPSVTTIDRLLLQFQRGQTHLAIVVDEYGGTAGLVTLEDVLEELVGEIRDEFDVEEVMGIERRPGGEAIVSAGLPVEEVADAFGFDADDATVDTIGGYVIQMLGRMPRVGDLVVKAGHRIEVIRMEHHRITHLRFRDAAEGRAAVPDAVAPLAAAPPDGPAKARAQGAKGGEG